jgi:PTS system fructose-specific IIC component
MKKINFRQHLMTAISYLIPFVSASGMLMVIGNILGGEGQEVYSVGMAIPDLFTTLGGSALGFIPVVVSAGIAYSIADRAGIAPGVILGILCQVNDYGFLGGIITGFLAGFLTSWLLKNMKVPQWFQGLLPQLILPLTVSLVIAVLMQYVIGVPITWLTDSIVNLLTNMQKNPGTVILFGAVVGVLSAIDYGGPINKVVFAFAVGLMSEGIGGPIANLIQASMVAPFGLTIGYFISKLSGKKLFSEKEVDALKTAFIMGIFQITEGSFPIILNDLVRITLCTALGSAVSGSLIAYFNVASSVPSGGIVAMPGFNHPWLWLLSLVIGSLVFAIALQFLKRKPEDIVVETDEGEEMGLDDLEFS